MREITDIPPGKLHKAGEDYLETILTLQMTKGLVRSVDVARAMNYSKPSVCKAVSVLQDAGYLTMDGEHFLHLTEVGKAIAERVYERHCFFTDLLVKIGVDPEIAEADACQMEHCISQESFDCLKNAREKLGF